MNTLGLLRTGQTPFWLMSGSSVVPVVDVLRFKVFTSSVIRNKVFVTSAHRTKVMSTEVLRIKVEL